MNDNAVRSQSARNATAITLASVAIAGVVLALVLGFATRGNEAHAAASPVRPSTSVSATVVPTVPVTKATPATQHSTPSAAPSQEVELVQRELAQLNYYNGSIDGQLGPQTQDAISSLQHDAHLKQTGQLDTDTQLALEKMLINGNNQMAG